MALFISKHQKAYPFISPTRPELTAEGRNIVITGGGTGIGKAIGVAFAQAGAKSVSILGRRVEKLEEGAKAISAVATKDTKVLTRAADMLKLEKFSAALKSIVDEVGKIDVFVSNAGTPQPLGAMVGYDVANLREGFETHMVGTLNSINAFVSFAGPEPIFLHTSSGLAHMATPMTGAYSTAKLGAAKIVEFFATENLNIHVVNISPGFIPTDLNGHVEAANDSVDLPGHFYVWLASPEAKFLKNKFVWANWDAEELLQRAEEIKSDSKLLTLCLPGSEA